MIMKTTYWILVVLYIWIYVDIGNHLHSLISCDASRAHYDESSTNAPDENMAEYNISNETKPWTAAVGGCGKWNQGQLYSPKNGQIVSAVDKLMVAGSSYWLGAQEYYTKWKWSDGSDLYRYIGYLRRNQAEIDEVFTNEWNDVYTAHRQCDSPFVGLQENTLFCLQSLDRRRLNKTGAQEQRCRGTYEEYCGDSRGMSVYRIPHDGGISEDWILMKQGRCASLRVNDWRSVSDLYVSMESKCHDRKQYLCEHTPGMKDCFHGICFGRRRMTWIQANQSCTLLKLTSQRMTLIKDAIRRRGWTNMFWVGLSRDREWLWIDGSQVLNVTRFTSDTDRMCLSLFHQDSGHSILEPDLCVWPLQFICEQNALPNKTVKPAATTSTSPCPMSASSAVTVSNVSFPVTETQHQQHNNYLVVGITVPAVILVLIVVVGVAVVCCVKRKNKSVFSMKKLMFFKQPRKTKQPEEDAGSIDSGVCYESNDDDYFTDEFAITNPDYIITDVHGGVYQNSGPVQQSVGSITNPNYSINDVHAGVYQNSGPVQQSVGSITNPNYSINDVHGGVYQNSGPVQQSVGSITNPDFSINDVQAGVYQNSGPVQQSVGSITNPNYSITDVHGGVYQNSGPVQQSVGSITNPDYVANTADVEYTIPKVSARVYQNAEPVQQLGSGCEQMIYQNDTVIMDRGNHDGTKDISTNVQGIDNRTFQADEGTSRKSNLVGEHYKTPGESLVPCGKSNACGTIDRVRGRCGSDEHRYEVPIPGNVEQTDVLHSTDVHEQPNSEQATMETSEYDIYEIPIFRDNTEDTHMTQSSLNDVILRNDVDDDVEYWTLDDVEDFQEKKQDLLPDTELNSTVCDGSDSEKIEKDPVYFVLEESIYSEVKHTHTMTVDKGNSNAIADSEV